MRYGSLLTTRHSNFAEGNRRACRYPVGVSPLSAIADASDASLEALASMLQPDEEIALGSPTEILSVGGLEAPVRMTLRQMVRSSLSRPITAQHVVPLGVADVADMLALIEIAKPGPFRSRTHGLGQYFGIRVDGRLVAMAGERLRPIGYTEISAVCTHPTIEGEDMHATYLRHSCETSPTGTMCLSCMWKNTIEPHPFTKNLGSR